MSTPKLSARGTTASVNYPKDFVRCLNRVLYTHSNFVIGTLGHYFKSMAPSIKSRWLNIPWYRRNALMHNELRDFIRSRSQDLIDSQATSFIYSSGPYGSRSIRAAISQFLSRHFKPASPLHADHITVTNGVSSAIEHCAWGLADPGDGILLGRPYYRSFIPDIAMRAGVNVVPVSFGTVDPLSPDCISAYEQALLGSKARGVPIRALMLCHPHNPLGRCYPRHTLIALLRFCAKYNVHLISDEIYALTVWENTIDTTGPAQVPFESILSIDLTSLIDPSLVHVLWGVSKDFGANGLRLGAIISPSNPAFIQACKACGLWSSPSSLAENAISQVLNDESFVANYISQNRKRVSNAYTHAINKLRKHGIEHAPGANAAFFVWINLGKVLRENITASLEAASLDQGASDVTSNIQTRLMAAKVFLVDGDAAGAEEPGWFRLVFTQPPEILNEGIERIAAALKD